MNVKIAISSIWGLFFCFQQLFCQDTAQARIYLEKGKELYENNQFDSALSYFQSSAGAYHQAQIYDLEITALLRQSSLLRRMAKYDQAEEVTLKAIEIGENHALPSNLPLANGYYYLGAVQMRKAEHKSAAESVEKGLNLLKKEENIDEKELPKFPILIGLIFKRTGDFDNALMYYREAEEILLNQENIDSVNLALVYNNLGTVYKQLEEYDKSFQMQFKSKEIYQKRYGENHHQMINSYINLANLYSRTGAYRQAIEYFEKARTITLDTWGENHPRTATIYNNLGICYINQSEPEKALSYFKKAVVINQFLGRENHPAQARLHTNIGLTYRHLLDYEASLNSHQQAIEVYEKNFGKSHDLLARAHINIGITYGEMEMYGQSDQNHRKALQIWEEIHEEDHPAFSNAFNNLGMNSFFQGNYEQAKKHFDRSLEIRLRFLPADHPLIMANYHNLARCLYKSGDSENALASIQKALATFDPEINQEDFFALPGLENGTGNWINLVNAMGLKAKILEDIYQKSKDQTYQIQSLNTLMHAFSFIDKIRTTFYSHESKSYLAENVISLYENGIETAYQLFTQTGDKEYLEKAFFISEQNKSYILLSSLYDSKARVFANIPNELLVREEELSQNILHFEKQLYAPERESILTDSSILTSLESQIFQYRQSRDSLIQYMEKAYPEYYRLKYQPFHISMDEIQNDILEKQEQMISYFVGMNSIYAISITKDETSLYKLPTDTEAGITLFSTFQNGIKEYFEAANPSDQLFREKALEWTQASYRLYDQFVAPLLINQKIEKLIIIPDGFLGYLPFGTLLNEPAGNPAAFKNHRYLIRDYEISYSYSASLLGEMINRKINWSENKKILALGPSFPEEEPQFAQRGNLSALYFNQDEATMAAQLFEGKALVGQEATLDNFLWHAPGYQILHLATHGITNDQNIDFSFLAFSPNPDPGSADRIFIRDLYQLNLNAELVVLSACETGAGKLIKGEGIASLARGFSFAGAKSLITSLWKVNDQKTAELMQLFYHELRPGKNKKAALQAAKINYLNQNDDFHSHPYFWAGFVPLGDMSPISNPSSHWGWLVFVVLIGIVIAVFIRKYY